MLIITNEDTVIRRYAHLFCQENLQALHLACQMGHLLCVKVLIEDFHADPNSKAKVHSYVCTHTDKVYVHV